MELPEAKYGTLLVESEPPLINIGTGEDVTITELAHLAARAVGFEGRLVFDTTKPDGTPRKLMDVKKIEALGWKHRIALEDGIRQTWEAVQGTF